MHPQCEMAGGNFRILRIHQIIKKISVRGDMGVVTMAIAGPSPTTHAVGTATTRARGKKTSDQISAEICDRLLWAVTK